MKNIALGLMLILALSAISFANISSDIASASAKKAAPSQTADNATVQVAVVNEKRNPVKESVGQVPNANVFNVWKPVQRLDGFRTVETPPNIYS